MRAARIFWGFALCAGLALPVRAQTVVSTVTAGTNPYALAANPVTNKIYVANQFSNNVTVIDGAANSTTTVNTGTQPYSVAVNPVTNKIYIANIGGNSVTVIDGATNSTATVNVGAGPSWVAVNPVTNKIYAANNAGATVTVIDGSNNSTSTVNTGTSPYSVAVNSVTNKIYVANYGANNVTVIDGSNNSTATVAAGTNPYAVAVNPAANKVYVANYGSGNVTIIDGSNNSTTTVPTGTQPVSVAVNPVTNKAYVANQGSGTVTVIDGVINSLTLSPGGSLVWVASNPISNQIYVASASGTITVIDGASNSTVSLSAGSSAQAVAVNPVTNKIYVANGGSNNVTVIDGATYATATIGVGQNPRAAIVNPVTNKIYVPNFTSGDVTVIDGATSSTLSVGLGTSPNNGAVNPITNKIYIANYNGSNVTVIDGATNGTTTVAAGSQPDYVAINPLTNKIYVTNQFSANVTVIDGATNTTTTVAAGTNPYAAAVNPVTNKIYVLNNGSANVTVIDGATNATTTVATTTDPISAAVNPVTNKIYVAHNSGSVTVIDGATNATHTVAAGLAPFWIAVNPVTNKIYVVNQTGATATVIDGATESTTTIPVGTTPYAVVVNPVTNKIYVSNSGSASSSVTIIDGATNSTTTVNTPGPPLGMDVNRFTNQVYVADSTGNSVTVITEQSVQANSLTAAITPLTNNKTTSPTPSLTFSGAGGVPAVQDVRYQADTWQGAWAGGGSASFAAATSALQAGTHIVYAYAQDSQAATSTQVGSPLVGNIAAYLFLVSPPVPAVTSTSPTNAIAGSAAFTLTVNGSNFTSFSTVQWNGLARSTTFVNTSQLTASIPATDIAASGLAQVSVYDSNAGLSGNVAFTINAGACNVNWTGAGGDGLWRTPLNWSSSTVPGSLDQACIANGNSVTVDASTTASVYSVTNSGTLNVTGGSVTIGGPSTSNGPFNMSGGVFNGPGTFALNGVSSFTGGTLQGSATWNVGPAGTLTLNGVQEFQIYGSVLNNSGTLVWSSTNNIRMRNGASINNLSGALFDVQNSQQIFCDTGCTTVVSNAGTFRKSAGGSANNIAVAFNNTGTVDVQTAGLNVTAGGTNSGTFNVAPGKYISVDNSYAFSGGSYTGAGTVQFTTGTATFSGTITSQNLIITGGTQTGSFTLSGTLGCTACSFQTGTMTINSGSALNATGGNELQFFTYTVNNSGTVTWGSTNAIRMRAGAAINNLSGGVFLVQNDTQIFCDSLTSTVSNSGTFRKNTATGTTTIGSGIIFNNTGTVDMQSGTLNIASGQGTNSGSFTAAAGTNVNFSNSYTFTGGSYTGAGSFQITAGTATLSGTLTTQNFAFAGGTYTGSFTLNGAASGTAGAFSSGTMTIPSGSSLSVTGGNEFDLFTYVLNNSGTITWTASNAIRMRNNGAINNLSGGLFLVQNDNQMFCDSLPSTVSNSGTFRKKTATGTTTIGSGITFNNTGTVDMQSGTLNLTSGLGSNSGSFTAAAGTSVLFTNSYTFNGGSYTGGGAFQISGGATLSGTITAQNLGFVGGTFTGTFTLSGTATATGGAFNGGAMTIASGGAFAITGSNECDLFTFNLNNSGTVTWDAANNIRLRNGTAINNLSGGAFGIQNDQQIFTDSGVNTINNAGTFQKLASAGTTTIGSGVIFTNTGTVRASSGTMSFVAAFTQSIGVTRLNGGNITAGTLSVNGGVLAGVGTITGNVTNAGTVSPGNSTGTLTISGNYTQTPLGSLLVALGGTSAGTFDAVAVGGTATLAGSLVTRFTNGFLAGATDTFTILTAGTRTGTFSNVGGLSQVTTYGATNVVLSQVAASGFTWIQQSPTGTPPAARGDGSMVYDSSTNQALLFGGAASGSTNNELWTLSNANGFGTPAWTQVTVSGPPPARQGHAAVYSASANRMIVFGGGIGSTSPCLNDVWVLTNANGSGARAWSQLSPTGTPPGVRLFTVTGYDDANNRMIVFGGSNCFNNGLYNDVWVLSNANGASGTPAWIQLTPSGTPPPVTTSARGFYDAASNRLTFFGGSPNNGANAPVSDTWVLTNANGLGGTPAWIQLSPTGTLPAGRSGHAVAYDPAANRMTIFGGSNLGGALNDTWGLSNANGLGGTPAWTQLAPAGTLPSPRYFSYSSYDAESGRLIIFGDLGGPTNDTWVLAGANGTVPAISAISPTTGTAGGAAFTLTVTGNNFDATSTVLWNGSARATTFISPAQLTATINAADIAAAGSAQVAVLNNSSGASSNVATFTIGNAVADLTISKTHTGNFSQGQTGAAYTITVSNVGSAPTSGTVTVVDAPPSAGGTTSSVVSDWSTTANPNGPWTYLQGTSVLPHQNLSSVFGVSDGFACPGGGCFLPAFWLEPGILRIHSVDASNGNPSLGEAMLKWTSPAAGFVSLGGTITYDHPGQQRSTDFTLSRGSTVLQSGTVSYLAPGPVALTANGLAVNAGDAITLKVQRSAGILAGAISDVTMTVILQPSPMGPTALSGTGWTCTLGTLTCTRSDALAAGNSYPPITLTANIAATAPASFSNTAAVSGGGETNTANNVATDPATVIPVAGVSLGSAPNPSTFGAPVTLTVTLTPASATGKVTFFDGTTVLGTSAVASGQATLVTRLLPSGSRALKAYYSGDGLNAAGLSNVVTQTVNAPAQNYFQPVTNIAAGSQPYAMAIGDFNGDGKLDFAVTNWLGGNVSIFLGLGNGTFQAAVNYAVGLNPAAVVAGDFNGDGKTDLVVTNYNSFNFSLLLGNGDGTFQAAVNTGTGSQPVRVAAGDFNGDGKLDVAVINDVNANVGVYLGNGDGTFAPPVTYSIGTTGRGIAVGDFNSDGRPDLVISNRDGNNVSVLIGNGDGTFQNQATYATGQGPYTVAVGDFNHDGKPDLVTSNTLTNDVSVLLGNGDGTFQAAVNYPAGITPGFVLVTGAGHLITTNPNDNSVNVLVGNGNGIFQAPVRFAVGSFPYEMVLGDFNGDGLFDLAVANEGTNNVSVLLGTQIPAPSISQILPSTAAVGGAAFTLTVNGSNFVNGATVNWNGSPRTTVFFNSTQLTASISASDIATAAVVPVTVTNPTYPVDVSPAANFTVTAQTYLVGDGFPNTLPVHAVGSFGDDSLNNFDLIAALRAVTSIPGAVPPVCSDLYDSMDSSPVDGASRGGDGSLNNFDLIETLRRVTLLDTTRPRRVSRGLTCPEAPLSTVRRNVQGITLGARGRRVPVYYTGPEDQVLHGLSLSLGGGLSRLQFVAGDLGAPTLLDNALEGMMALAWLGDLRIVKGRRVLLGYVEMPQAATLEIFGGDTSSK